MQYSIGGYRHAYGAMPMILASQVNSNRLADSNYRVYPGQLVKAEFGTVAGSIYQPRQVLDLSAYGATNINWMPGMLDGTNLWTLFMEKPDDGGQGPPGIQGGTGVGNLKFRSWEAGFTFDYSTNYAWLAEYDMEWYQMIKTNDSTGESPASYPAVWSKKLARGRDGTMVVVSNVVDRGAWSSTAEYTNWHRVRYGGNIFIVDATNASPPVGTSPTLGASGVGVDSAYWSVETEKGAQGIQGPSGEVTYYNTYVANEYRLFDDAYTVFSNLPTSSSNIIQWVGSSNGTNYFKWIRPGVIGTNILTVTNGELLVNGRTMAVDPAVLTNALLGAEAHGWGNHADAGYLVPTDLAQYRVNATSEAAYAESVQFPDGSVLSSAAVGSIAPSNLPGTLSYVDQSNTWTSAQSFPAGTTIGGAGVGAGGSGASGAESEPMKYAWSTNITLRAGTNPVNQRIMSIDGATTVFPPTKESVSNDYILKLTIPSRGTNAFLFATNDPPVVGYVPLVSTTAYSVVLVGSDAGSSNVWIRRVR